MLIYFWLSWYRLWLLLAPKCVSTVFLFPNLILRINNFFDSYAVLVELKERRAGSKLGHMPSSRGEF
jgi:hypothetical protein